MNRKEKANAYHDMGYNCCQAVVAAFSDVIGIDEKTCLAIGGGFGGGLRCGEICGAVSGAVMVLGLTHPYTDNGDMNSKNRIAQQTKAFHKRFKELYGCERCVDRLKTDISSPELLAQAKANGITKKCPMLISSAVEIVEDLLQEKN